MDTSTKIMTRREMLVTLLTGFTATACSTRLHGPEPTNELILCGWDEVFILPIGNRSPATPRKVWSWKATECPDIPEALQRAFRSTDDCKPVDGGRKILVSSSSGAVALIERESRRALFYAQVPNAHSIELLPGGRIAAAASVSESLPGNRVIIFDMASRQELTSDPLVSAHGLVWDEERDLLWALGNNLLRAYRLVDAGDTKLNLKLDFQMSLPEANGHDLSAVPATPLLFLSTGRRCWTFNRNTRQLLPQEILANTPNVKSYSVHPSTGRIAYIQAEGKNWWAQHIHFLNPRGELHLPQERLYKARWM